MLCYTTTSHHITILSLCVAYCRSVIVCSASISRSSSAPSLWIAVGTQWRSIRAKTCRAWAPGHASPAPIRRRHHHRSSTG
jgi:hypothetical protein